MTNSERIIGEVLELDQKAERKPWAHGHATVGLSHIIMAGTDDENFLDRDVIINDDEANDLSLDLIAHYRSSAPKLAMALQTALISLRKYEIAASEIKALYPMDFHWIAKTAREDIEKLLGDE